MLFGREKIIEDELRDSLDLLSPSINLLAQRRNHRFGWCLHFTPTAFNCPYLNFSLQIQVKRLPLEPHGYSGNSLRFWNR